MPDQMIRGRGIEATVNHRGNQSVSLSTKYHEIHTCRVSGVSLMILSQPRLDEIRAGVLADRSQFFKDLTEPFYGANRPGAKVSQGVRDAFWLQSEQAGLKNEYECIKAFSETDFTEDLKKFDVPTLIIHGDDDQIVPIGASALISSKIVKNSTLKVYEGGPHGVADTHKDQLNADLLAFLRE